MQFLDPTHEAEVAALAPPPRLKSLAGTTIGIISNGKEGTRKFFAALETELLENHDVANVVLLTKPNYSAPAPAAMMAEAKSFDAIISGIGD